MKILIAPDKFKGTLTAQEVCDTIAEGIISIKPNTEIIKLPLADGGEGFTEAIIGKKAYKIFEITVNDPLGRWKNAKYLMLGESTAIIESSNASGLKLLTSSERNPMKASSMGTGELIRNAIENGANEIIIGIGGSATNDGGMGMAEALGFRFFNKNGDQLKSSGENLIKVSSISSPINKPWEQVTISVACDVENTLFGTNGAAYVFGPQKGANAQQVKDLDDGLRQFSRVVNKHLGQQFHFISGAGAAGGLGYGLMAFLGAELKSGIEIILEANHFEEKLKGVDLVITGEGKIDSQTLQGKVIAGVCHRVQKQSIPIIAFCGVNEIDISEQMNLGLKYLIPLVNGNISSAKAMAKTKEILLDSVKDFFTENKF